MAKGFTGLQILVFQLVITSLLMGRNVTGIAHSSSLVVPSPLTGIIELTTIKSKQASPPIIELVVATKSGGALLLKPAKIVAETYSTPAASIRFYYAHFLHA